MISINDFALDFSDKSMFKNFNAEFTHSNIYGVFGLNGSGKTTLFKSMYGIYRYSGQITLNNEVIKRESVSFLETDMYFYQNLTAQEYLDVFEPLKSDDFFDFKNLTTLLAIPLEENINTFSTGMLKKLAFLCIVRLNRKVLLLDEPFNGVDIESVEIIKGIIRKLNQSGKIILIASHIKEHLLDTCSSFLVLERECQYKHFNREDFTLYLENMQHYIDEKISDALNI